MGKAVLYTCDCGYNKELLLGGGLSSSLEASVRQTFSELSSFNRAKQSGALTRFYWEYKLAVCHACKELLAIPILHYWEYDRERILQAPCPACGGSAELVAEKDTAWPKCGKRMAALKTGLWD